MAASTFLQKNTQTGKTTRQSVLNWQNILFVLVTLALLAIGIWMRIHKLYLPFDRDSYDEGVYWQSLRAMSGGHALYQQIFYSQPPFFLFSIFPTFMLLGQTLSAARLGMALVSLFGLAGAFLLGKAVSGRVGAIAALLLLIMDPLYLRESQTIQAEAPSAALSMLAVGLIYLWWERPDDVVGLCLAVLSAIALALGILSKLLAVSALVPVGLLMLARIWHIWQQAPEKRLKHASSLIAGIIAFIITFALLILPFAGSFQQFWQGVVTFHTTAGSVLKASSSGNLKVIGRMLISLTSLAALYGTIVALLRRDWRVLPLLAWFLATALILWRQVPLLSHHMVALVPPLIALAAIGIGPLPDISTDIKSVMRPRTILPLVGLLLILIASIQGGSNILQYYHAQQNTNDVLIPQQNKVIKDLQSVTQPDQLVVTDAQFITALANRSTPPELVDTSSVRIATGYVTFQQLVQVTEQPQVHAVLFYTGRLAREIPAFHTWVSQHFHLLKRYSSGKELWVKI
ncbi:MAG: phospholipid carrier-dependent glycosyltransferase [Ktedonobacteraceae bacterium]|nr:phospholipid carrier-dependent glycosyltransferase [Ktedonobacteraceae bacterium]